MRSLALALVAAAACATAGEADAPAPSPFEGVRSLALLRSADDRGRRPKDPLDGLDESLRARGFTTRVVELGGSRAPELAAAERLFEQLERRAGASRSERIARPVASAGGGVASLVAELGVDAVASYHRLDLRPSGPPPAPIAGAPYAPAPPPTVRPTGALVLADHAGRVATFAWGDAGAFDDPALPANAAEAIDQLVRALTGEPREE